MNTNPFVLLSLINTKLRDQYDNLEELCEDLNYDINELKDILSKINYFYNEDLNQFK